MSEIDNVILKIKLSKSIADAARNVVPCCIICNTIKSDLSLKEFDIWLNNIQKHFLENS